MDNYILFLVIYFAVISLASIYLTVKDKKASKNKQWRIPEATLLLFGLFGGALAMFITMKKIRHKTKHIKFMLGLPLEIVLHIGVIVALIYIL